MRDGCEVIHELRSEAECGLEFNGVDHPRRVREQASLAMYGSCYCKKSMTEPASITILSQKQVHNVCKSCKPIYLKTCDRP